MKRPILAGLLVLLVVTAACTIPPDQDEGATAKTQQAFAYCNGTTCAYGESCCNSHCTPIAGRCGSSCSVCDAPETCSSGHCCPSGRTWCETRGACVTSGICECPPSLEDWLDDHANVAGQVKWQATNSTGSWPNAYEPIEADKVAYASWSASMKQSLLSSFNDRYVAYCKNQAFTETVVDPPANVFYSVRDPNDRPYTSVTESSARALYIASVAHSLALEVGGFLPWSVTGYSSENLAVIFDSASMFARSIPGSSYSVGGWFSGYVASHRRANKGLSVPPPPYAGYSLMKGWGPGATTNLVGSSRLSTIIKFMQWERATLTHYTPPALPDTNINFQQTWGYRGLPPATRVIAGTNSTAPNLPPGQGFAHWIAGCGGNAGFMRDVLRTVNIPVMAMRVCEHYQIYFPTEGLYLEHGDDPYSGYEDAFWPVESLFIDQAKYTAWFGTNLHNEDQFEPDTSTHCQNLDNRMMEIAEYYAHQ